ncbi:MAG: guanylate kinase, partial [Lachnospiraceae bacterium]|nr:guanylate kinase [Lachnospiraceae bacterium]
AYEESLGIEQYDYLVINDELEVCVDCVNNIIANERSMNQKANEDYRASANIGFINNMRKELFSFSKGE